ncbi:MAG: hypothetical protein QG657_4555 [Acidobacteriota bacterium]|nr:hypothetical protein [Acidobacteriota bacterium]
MAGRLVDNFCRAKQLITAILIILLFGPHLSGLDPAKSVDQYLVDQWGIPEGIPSDTIHSITQTQDGYLWIATPKGLLRFDGIKFSTIRFVEAATAAAAAADDSLANTIPDTLFVDREGTLWIGGSGVLTSYQYTTGRFKTYTAADGLTVDRIRHIKDDMKGNLWISFFASYVNRFANGEFTVFNGSHGLGSNKINAIVEDRNGNLLFGARENGMFIYKNEKFLQYPVPDLDNVQIICMHEDRDGDLWIGTNNGLFRVSEKGARKYTTKDGLSDGFISRMMEDSDRNTWVGTLKGLNRLKKNQDGAVSFESLFTSHIITWLFEDREKNVWIGTYNSGIKRLKDGKFISYTPLEAYQEEILQSVFEDSRGDTWIGALSGKLFRCRGSDFIEALAPTEFSGTAISAIAEDNEGNLWLGTNGNGVFQMKKNKTFSRFSTRDGLADNLVTSISRDSKGNLWCSTFDGVSVIRVGNDKPAPVIESFNSRNGLSGKVANNVYEDKAHNIWIAADKGITVLKEGKIDTKDITYYLQGISVTCIYEDLSTTQAGSGESVYWASTHGSGFWRIKRAKAPNEDALYSFTTAHGLTTNFIYQFFEDAQENFWIMSDSGILRVGKNELNRLADGGAGGAGGTGVTGGTEDIDCTSFGISDGMKSHEFNNEFSRSSALKTRNGEFRFITKKGISIVNPARIQIDKLPPPVVIETVLFNRKPIPLHLDNQTGSNSYKGITDFQFCFTAPTFLYPEKIKFKYRLEGFDRDWIFLAPGKERAALYDNLKPGTYTFKVIAANSEGVWNKNGDALTFTLKPFYYETLIFKIGMFLLLMLLAAAIYYIIKKRPFEKIEKYKGSPLDPRVADECIKKLTHLVEIKKVYCAPDISLQTLAEKLGVSPHVLSQVLNEKLNRTFSDFINFHRIEEAKRILRETGEEQKIANVALDVGFNTLAVFYTAFKKFTDMTPAQYKKSTGANK